MNIGGVVPAVAVLAVAVPAAVVAVAADVVVLQEQQHPPPPIQLIWAKPISESSL